MATLSNGENDEARLWSDGIHWEFNAIEAVHKTLASGKESEASLGSFSAKIPEIGVHMKYRGSELLSLTKTVQIGFC